jgi:hypothetical protein
MNNVARTRIGVFCLWALCLAGAAHPMERIGAFHADIRIASSGELSVTETIEVQASGRDRQRGIVRQFPADYRDRLGRRMRISVVVDKVLRNGRAEPYALQRAANGMRLRTGTPGRALSRGKHVYEIAYRTARRIRFFEAHDELHWKVAAGVELPLERLSAEVRFERPVAADRMKLDAYTGAESARGQDYHGFVREGAAAFRATRALAPREGMTITVAFPKGVVEPPSIIAGGAGYLSANLGVPVGIAVLALMLALLFACRARSTRACGRPGRASPPEGVGPGGVRFIDHGRFDERCLSAALLGLQSRGYLRIREHGERFRLERTANEVDWFPGEEKLTRRLLRDAHEMRRRGRAMEEAGRAFAKELYAAFGCRAWTSEGSFVLAAAGIGLAGVAAMHALETPHEAIAALAAVMATVLAVFAVHLVPLYRARGRVHQPDIEALRRYLGTAEPQSEEEFSRLLPYAVALELENVWGRRFVEKLPANLVGISARGEDRAPARPRRPLRHRRSAAA